MNITEVVNVKNLQKEIDRLTEKESYFPYFPYQVIEFVSGAAGIYLPSEVGKIFGEEFDINDEFVYDDFTSFEDKLTNEINTIITIPEGFYLVAEQFESDCSFGLTLYKDDDNN